MRESLKEVVNGAESMLRVARARIVTLERQLKEVRTELDTARRKYKDMEQLVNNENLVIMFNADHVKSVFGKL